MFARCHLAQGTRYTKYRPPEILGVVQSELWQANGVMGFAGGVATIPEVFAISPLENITLAAQLDTGQSRIRRYNQAHPHGLWRQRPRDRLCRQADSAAALDGRGFS